MSNLQNLKMTITETVKDNSGASDKGLWIFGLIVAFFVGFGLCFNLA